MSDKTYRLWVSRPGESEREYETQESHGDHTRESADAVLAGIVGEWCEAELSDPRPHSDGWLGVLRRGPSTAWREVRRWPERAEHETRGECYADAEAITAWLRAAGVTVEWPAVLAQQWPGHERGRMHAACALDPDRTFRHGHERRQDALEHVVWMILAEGQESGALLHRVNHNCDAHDDDRDAAWARRERERAEMRELRNEVRRLKGEREISEEEERAAGVAEMKAHLARFVAGRKTPTP